MRAGPMRYRVMLQKRAAGRLPSGQPATGWTDVKSVRASIADVSGRELINSGAEVAGKTSRIWIRNNLSERITSGWRVVHNPPTGKGEVYDIKSVISAENGTRLELLCEEGVKQ